MRIVLVILVALLGGGCATAPPNSAAAWTYPVWGLPRDLADAPLTAINRTGFGTFVVRKHCTYIASSAGIAVGVAQVAGTAAWISHGFGAGVATNVSVLAHGLAITLGSDLAYGAVVNPIQVALLRTGFDERYFKYADHDDESVGTAQEDDLRQRSRAFFPNWQALGTELPLP